MSDEEYAAFFEAHRTAAQALQDREARLAAVYPLLEHSVDLLGVTAIEVLVPS